MLLYVNVDDLSLVTLNTDWVRKSQGQDVRRTAVFAGGKSSSNFQPKYIDLLGDLRQSRRSRVT